MYLEKDREIMEYAPLEIIVWFEDEEPNIAITLQQGIFYWNW
jgi:hypothetical protein